MAKVSAASFTRQKPIPSAPIVRFVAIMQLGCPHGRGMAEEHATEVLLSDQEFHDAARARHSLSVPSGCHASTTAQRAFGLWPGKPVPTRPFAPSPGPGAGTCRMAEIALIENCPRETRYVMPSGAFRQAWISEAS
jgi:hypothetical protein